MKHLFINWKTKKVAHNTTGIAPSGFELVGELDGINVGVHLNEAFIHDTGRQLTQTQINKLLDKFHAKWNEPTRMSMRGSEDPTTHQQYRDNYNDCVTKRVPYYTSAGNDRSLAEIVYSELLIDVLKPTLKLDGMKKFKVAYDDVIANKCTSDSRHCFETYELIARSILNKITY